MPDVVDNVPYEPIVHEDCVVVRVSASVYVMIATKTQGLFLSGVTSIRGVLIQYYWLGCNGRERVRAKWTPGFRQC